MNYALSLGNGSESRLFKIFTSDMYMYLVNDRYRSIRCIINMPFPELLLIMQYNINFKVFQVLYVPFYC